ncbi:MAG: TetR/AcrR family transcriptional regulator [Bacteroidales bacterium]|jgi:AcrR family transcriptional regulator|nr:TetR/AcrR family transcriptional regulator [Bacteroidales bacterium]
MVKERDRQQSEEKLINAVGELIEEIGFENLGINQVAKKAGFSKNLIYRYFESLDGLIYAYMKKHDFWVNAHNEKPSTSDIKTYLKDFYRREIAGFRGNIALKRLRRWELSTDKDFVVEIRAQREKNGVQFMEIMSGFVKIDKEQLQAISALIDAGIAYLAMFEDNCKMYNGIDIQSNEGWEQILKGVDLLIETMIK